MNAAEIHREYMKVYNGERAVDGLGELFHPDYSFTGGNGVQSRGVEFALTLARRRLEAFPDHTVEIVHQYAPQNDVSIMEIVVRGTQRGPLIGMGIPPTGKRMEVVAVSVIETRDGKIYRERNYFDTGTLRHQLGAP
jgi:steroid delta-isomerase-like uncharacterized protein